MVLDLVTEPMRLAESANTAEQHMSPLSPLEVWHSSCRMIDPYQQQCCHGRGFHLTAIYPIFSVNKNANQYEVSGAEPFQERQCPASRYVRYMHQFLLGSTSKPYKCRRDLGWNPYNWDIPVMKVVLL